MADVPVGRLPVGRRRFERQRRADEPAHRSPAADLFGRVRGIRARRKTFTTSPTRGWSRSSSAATTTRSASPPTSAATTCRSWSTSRTNRSAIRPVCRCTSSAGRRRKRRRHRRARRRGERRGVRWLRRHGAHLIQTSPRRAGSGCGGCRASCARVCSRRAGCCGRPPGAPTCCGGPRDGQPLYWGLDVVFWDNEKAAAADRRRARTARRAPAVAGRRARVADLRRSRRPRQPHADLLQQMSVVELREPAPRASAHAGRQAVDGALDSRRARRSSMRRWSPTACRCRAALKIQRQREASTC